MIYQRIKNKFDTVDVSAKVLAVVEDRVLIHSTWADNFNILWVSKDYFMNRYGVQL